MGWVGLVFSKFQNRYGCYHYQVYSGSFLIWAGHSLFFGPTWTLYLDFSVDILISTKNFLAFFSFLIVCSLLFLGFFFAFSFVFRNLRANTTSGTNYSRSGIRIVCNNVIQIRYIATFCYFNAGRKTMEYVCFTKKRTVLPTPPSRNWCSYGETRGTGRCFFSETATCTGFS